jgi:hypothetical protein|tara:strand:+ start:307 stop:666 length:360 start_codon:yes stop_codon:yes gene_type:complete
MTELVACLSTGKGTWAQLYHLIKAEPWDKIILITNPFGMEKFDNSIANVEFVLINSEKDLQELTEDIRSNLASRIKGLEVAVNIVSGSGKEHMALLAALLKIGVGMRFISANATGSQEL